VSCPSRGGGARARSWGNPRCGAGRSDGLGLGHDGKYERQAERGGPTREAEAVRLGRAPLDLSQDVSQLWGAAQFTRAWRSHEPTNSPLCPGFGPIALRIVGAGAGQSACALRRLSYEIPMTEKPSASR